MNGKQINKIGSLTSKTLTIYLVKVKLTQIKQPEKNANSSEKWDISYPISQQAAPALAATMDGELVSPEDLRKERIPDI